MKEFMYDHWLLFYILALKSVVCIT